MSKDGLLTRRRAIATIGAASTLLLPGRRHLAADTRLSDIASGTVFEDRNGDARRAKGARGIPGVMVSNGVDVTLTDSDGRWSIPVQSGDHIFVITPSHWTTAGRGRSSFSYLHQPDGTPVAAKLCSPAIAPTGALPESIDFPLLRQPQSQCFEVLLFADTQAADAKELGYVRQVLLSATRGTNAVFAIHHGDAMADDLALLPQYLNILNETGLAWHHCPGNHDMNLDTQETRYAFETWKRFIGPTNYAFQYGGATFILLNNVDYLGRSYTEEGCHYRGLFGEKQLRFVSNVLRHVPPDQLIAVSMHIPLQSFDTPDSAANTAADRGALLKLLAARPHTVSFSGHSHTTEHYHFGRGDGFDRNVPHHHQVLTAACGSWWSGPLDSTGVPVADSRDGTPKGFHVLSVDGNQCSTRYAPFGPVADLDLRVIVDNAGPQSVIFVDVFDGDPRTRVTYEIEGEPSSIVQLNRNGVADPYVVEEFARYRHMCKPWVAAAPSSHVWSGALPHKLASGGKTLIVRVTDKNERTFTRRQTV
jgi:hypothetical protein